MILIQEDIVNDISFQYQILLKIKEFNLIL